MNCYTAFTPRIAVPVLREKGREFVIMKKTNKKNSIVKFHHSVAASNWVGAKCGQQPL